MPAKPATTKETPATKARRLEHALRVIASGDHHYPECHWRLQPPGSHQYCACGRKVARDALDGASILVGVG